MLAFFIALASFASASSLIGVSAVCSWLDVASKFVNSLIVAWISDRREIAMPLRWVDRVVFLVAHSPFGFNTCAGIMS
jgi:hypothetical protein